MTVKSYGIRVYDGILIKVTDVLVDTNVFEFASSLAVTVGNNVLLKDL